MTHVTGARILRREGGELLPTHGPARSVTGDLGADRARLSRPLMRSGYVAPYCNRTRQSDVRGARDVGEPLIPDLLADDRPG
jgi:hypothetical protein